MKTLFSHNNFLLLTALLISFSACEKTANDEPEIKTEPGNISVEWIKNGDSPSFSIAMATDIVVDASGNTYIAGIADNPVVFGTIAMNDFSYGSIFLAKMDKDGNFIWVKDLARSHFARAKLAIDSRDNPVIYFTASALPVVNNLQDILFNGDENIGIAKFTSAGLCMWSVSAGSYHNSDISGSIAIDNQDNIFITGGYHKFITYQDKTLTNKLDVTSTFIAKLDGGGKCGWIQEANQNQYKRESDFTNVAVYALAPDSKGNCYFSGRYVDSLRFGGYQISTTNMSGFIAMLNPLGKCQWISPGDISFPVFKTLKIDGNDNLICGGAVSKNTSMDKNSMIYTADASLLFAKLSPSHEWSWVKELVKTEQTIPEMGSTCTSVAIDKADNIYITGNSNGSTNIGGNTFNTSTTSEEMIYVAKFSPECKFNWLKTNNLTDKAASSEGIAVDNNNNCYIAGFRNRAFSMDDKQLKDGRGVFVIKIKQ